MSRGKAIFSNDESFAQMRKEQFVVIFHKAVASLENVLQDGMVRNAKKDSNNFVFKKKNFN